MEFHSRDKRLKSLFNRIERLDKKQDIKILKKYQDHLFANGLSNARILAYIEPVYIISRENKKLLEQLDKLDIKKIIAWIENRDVGEHSKHGYKVGIKRFIQFVEGYEWNSKEFPDRVSWINTKLRRRNLNRPIIMTKMEVLRLFKVVRGSRNKSLVSFMYESGARTDEILRLKVGDVEFDEYGAKIKLTSGKVGSRQIRLVSCIPHLRNWLEDHPSPKSSSPLWSYVSRDPKTKGKIKGIGYVQLVRLLNRWKKDAGIDKRITPYSFRRTRATHVSSVWGHGTMCKFFGWTFDTKVISRYVELNDEVTDDAILNFYGIKSNSSSDIKSKWCPKCNKQHPPEIEFCDVCNAPLTETARLEVEKKRKVEKTDLFKEIMEMVRKEMRS